jgi:hypothetical protein
MAQAQAKAEQKYERTRDPKRMLAHRLLNEAIRKDWSNVRGFLPARTSTSLEYKAGATKAKVWDHGKEKVSIHLPLADGWYVPDGNPFYIPNGCKSSPDNSDALYLVRNQESSFSGPVARFGDGFGGWWRNVVACGGWSGDSGVALIGREVTTPLAAVPEEKLVEVADPKALVQRAQLLEAAAKELTERLGEVLSPKAHIRLIKPPLDEAAFLRELAGKIEAIQKKA